MRSLLMFFMCLIPTVGYAQDTLWTPQHVAKLRSVVEAVIAPDGTQVAYVHAVPRELPREKDGGSWTELHVVDTKGNATPFITGAVNVSNLAWTPDGKQIAFLSKRDKDDTRALYVIGTRGGEARKLVTHATDIQGYSFSGDGKQVAFLATEPTAKTKKTLQDQGFSQEIYEEDQPFVRVWIAPLAGRASDGPNALKQDPSLARPANMLKLEGSASELHFNPKEDKLAVALAPTPLIDDHLMFRKVHIVDIKTGKATNLDNPGKLGQIAWSPDGKKLAMITGKDKHDPKEGRLWFHDFDAKGLREVHPELKQHVESIAWDGKDNLLYLASNGVDTAFGKCTLIAANGEYSLEAKGNPGFRPKVLLGNLTTTRNAFAFIGQSPTHPFEVYIWGIGKDDAPRRLTDSNPWLKTMQFAKQEVVAYKTKDGIELEGILIYPLNRKPDERYPLVLHVHGGPESHYSNGWITRYADLGQVAAARGMASFYPNYRGSTGYGVEFSMKGQKEAAGKEFDDLIDGVDHLIKMGLVDEKKVGITGGSYGGYATAWGSTYYSHRFAAGVMFVGLSNLVSCAGTTDIPQEMFLVHHRKWLWDDWNYHLNASPVKHIEKHKTPLLILHGKNDPRVHPSQSMELYRHLKVRNQAPVRLVLYPGEGHGNRRAASRLDYNIRLLQWMEHYLKGPGGAMPAMEIDYGINPAAAKTTSVGWDSATTAWIGRGCPCCIGW
jgi:dipeptidyl aminopeptidase/acylaminoacyl peptidase